MKKSRFLWVIISSWAYVHTKPLIHDGASWNKIKIKGRVPKTERLRYWFEPNLRLIFNKNIFFESVNRIALGYHFAEHKTIWQGYTINPFIKNNKFGLEHRVWQQLYMGFYPTPHLKINSRTRLENRWIDLTPGNAVRLRQKIQLKWKVPALCPARPVIFDEIFFNLTHPQWVSESALNQNRAFAGFDFYLSEHNFLRVGYMNRYSVLRLPFNTMQHAIWIALHVDFK